MRIVFILICALIPHIALAMDAAERRELLNAIRPAVIHQAGQPVRLKIDRLNHQSGWVLLTGELVAVPGQKIDWKKAKDCDPTLDKMLWVVAHKALTGWKIEELFICATEPRNWYFDETPDVTYARPCGIYAGLVTVNATAAEQACLAFQSDKNRKAPKTNSPD